MRFSSTFWVSFLSYICWLRRAHARHSVNPPTVLVICLRIALYHNSRISSSFLFAKGNPPFANQQRDGHDGAQHRMHRTERTKARFVGLVSIFGQWQAPDLVKKCSWSAASMKHDGASFPSSCFVPISQKKPTPNLLPTVVIDMCTTNKQATFYYVPRQIRKC